MPRSDRVERRIWWLTVSKAAERSRRIRTEERDAALAVCKASDTARRAVSVECEALKPDCRGSRRWFWERKRESCSDAARSRVLERNERRETGL